MTRYVLPIAQREYDRREEQNFRDWVRRNLDGLLSSEGLPAYSGVQVISAKGTSSSFAVASGAAPLYLPMESIIYDTNDRDLSNAPHKITAPYGGFAQITGRIDNIATGTGSTLSDVTFGIYKNNVLMDTTVVQLNTTNAWKYTGVVSVMLAKGDEITIKMSHSKGSAFNLDLTKSQLTIQMLSPNPQSIDRSRI